LSTNLLQISGKVKKRAWGAVSALGRSDRSLEKEWNNEENSRMLPEDRNHVLLG